MTNLSDIRSALSGKTDVEQANILYSVIGTMIDENDADLTATWDEVNAVADMSGQVVAPATGNLSITAALHGNRVLYYDDADGVISLPAATGSGIRYTVVLKTAWTTGSIEALSVTATFVGGLNAVDDDADAPYAYKAETGDNTITGSAATGGDVGDWFEFLDVATDLFVVKGFVTQSGGSETTPFSAAS